MTVIKGLEEDGSCALRLETPMSEGNISEILAELEMEDEKTLPPMKLADEIFKYQKYKGYTDPCDWIDGGMSMIANFCVNAADVGAKNIVFE
jgi:hypothetical protein